MRTVLGPVGALHMVIGSKERMKPLRGIEHVAIGFRSRVVPLVVLARARQAGERSRQIRSQCTLEGWLVGGIEGQGGRAAERRAHQHHRSEHIRTHQRAPGRDRRAEIVTDNRLDAPMPQSVHQADGIARKVEHSKLIEVGLITTIPACGPSVASLIGCHHVITGIGQCRHQLSPAVGQLGKSM